jgi:NADH:quinone reductase (non-electrogenic)
VKGPDVLTRLDGLETNRIGQLVVTETLQTTRDPDIFAIGDCAACPQPGGAGDVRHGLRPPIKRRRIS